MASNSLSRMEKRTLFSCLEYLQELSLRQDLDDVKESIEVACQCIRCVFLNYISYFPFFFSIKPNGHFLQRLFRT